MPLFIIVLLSIAILILIAILSKKEKEKIEFFHVMAHRFRSPISIIKWYIELLSDTAVGTLNYKQKKYFTQIYKASERLTETIDFLLVLLELASNKLSVKIQTINIGNLTDHILQKLQFKIERHRLHLQKIYPKDQEIIIQTDPKLLGIVFQNLIENAIRYTPENGNISVSVLISDANKQLSIEIKDDGYGIPKNEQSKIFTKLYRASNIKAIDPQGTGLGLYIVKSIIEKLGGSIWFISEENKGTAFSISLPL